MRREKIEYTVRASNPEAIDKAAEIALKYAYELYMEYKIKQELEQIKKAQ